jgi:hypothetical protein
MLAFTHNFWFIQAIGAIALVFIILGWSSKERKHILGLQIINFIFFIIHYILLGAYMGAANCGMSLLRNVVFLRKNDRAWAAHPAWFWIFSALSLTTLALFWRGWITILPAAGTILGTWAITKDRPADIRFYMLIACILWIPYTIVVHSYSGLVSQIVGVVGITLGMYRHDRKGIV